MMKLAFVGGRKVTRLASNRPYRSYYYVSDSTRKRNEYDRIGRSSSILGTMCAAMKALENGEYERVDVYDEDEALIMIAKLRDNGIDIRFKNQGINTTKRK